MPIFELIVRDATGQLQKRQESGDSATALTARLQQSGLMVMLCREQHATPWPWRRPSRAPTFSLLLFCRELQILLQAGLPLMEALLILKQRQGTTGYQGVVTSLVQHLEQGASLSEALTNHPDAFPRLFVAMVAASEHTGALGEALSRYIAYQESWQTVRSKLISAAIYPAILVGVGTLVGAFMLFYLAPKFSLVYQQSDSPLHLSTALLLHWGAFVQAHQLPVALTLAGLLTGLVVLLRAEPTRQRLLQRILRIGPLAQLMHVVVCTQFYRSLALLLRGGNTVTSSLELCRQVLPSHYQSALTESSRRIQQGASISEAFSQHGLTTDIAERMLHSGENSGQLAHMLEQTALFHEREIMERIERLSRVLEPVLMLVMGLIIGTLVIGMYLPIFDVAGQL